jgi:twitching motility protein PilJ
MSKQANKRRSGHPLAILLLAGLLLASLAFVAVTFFLLMRNATHEQEWIRLTTDVQVASQQLSKSAGEAAAGNLEAYTELAATHERMAIGMQSLRTGVTETGLPPLPSDVSQQLDELGMVWERMSGNTLSITERKGLLLALADASGAFSGAIPGIQENTDAAVRGLVQSGAPTAQVFAASRQLVLADRMLRRVTEILQGGSSAVNAASSLGREMRSFDQVLTALLQGNQELGITPVRNQQTLAFLNTARSQFAEARPQLQTILDSSSDLFQVRGAADEIFLDSGAVFESAAALSNAIADLPRSREWPSLRSGVFGLIFMIGIVSLLIASVIASERRRATVATRSRRKQQRAILQLLDELGSLADGDLTVRATVTDEITGAIADAINYAVEQLRELVRGINDTAMPVAESAQAARGSSAELAQAAGVQAEQVGSATDSVHHMVASFDSMAKRLHSSSEVAHQSVDIAHHGAEKVRETIRGMDSIREQIQETSKRIKRLGESSQEIGDIVRLINGIAEQTNVLALNAAIQAASAGGAGKGFAVVADEVQQLAESATNATRRIDMLVQTIQADTSGAVDSMESTTTEVVNGAQMAEDAGTALKKIEKASIDLSALIQKISTEAQSQSETATRISELMHSIRDVSVKTSETSKQTADSVENLAELVIHLSESVADFKLPEEDR